MVRPAAVWAALALLCLSVAVEGRSCLGSHCEAVEPDESGLLQKAAAPGHIREHSSLDDTDDDSDDEADDHAEALIGKEEDEELEVFPLIAGSVEAGVSLTNTALKGTGWKKKFEVVVTGPLGFKDAAAIYRRKKHCVLGFSAADDEVDSQQVLGALLLNPKSLCGFDVHGGTVDEMESFTRERRFQKAVKRMNRYRKCRKVTVVGHSFGGALATLFAACANRGNDKHLFGHRQDYRLVTFGNFRIAATGSPIYNKLPGVPFEGTRYAITEKDLSPLAALNRSMIVQFRIDILTFYVPLLAAVGRPDLSTLATEKIALYQNYTVDEVNADWPSVETALAQYFLFLITLGQDPPAGLEPFQGALFTMVGTFQAQGLLNFEYDVVPSLTGPPFLFQSALVPFQPLPQPLKSPGASYPGVSAASATNLPDNDYMQLLLGTLALYASGGGNLFPNHPLCCYSSLPDCAERFNVTYKACIDNPLR